MMYIELMRKKAIAKYAYGVQMMNLVAFGLTFVIMIVTMILSDIAGCCYGVENAYGAFEGVFKLMIIMIVNAVSYVVAELVKSKMES